MKLKVLHSSLCTAMSCTQNALSKDQRSPVHGAILGLRRWVTRPAWSWHTKVQTVMEVVQKIILSPLIDYWFICYNICIPPFMASGAFPRWLHTPAAQGPFHVLKLGCHAFFLWHLLHIALQHFPLFSLSWSQEVQFYNQCCRKTFLMTVTARERKKKYILRMLYLQLL